MLVARCGTYETAVEEAKSFGDGNPSCVYHVHYVDERLPGTMMWGFWAVDDVTDGVFEIRTLRRLHGLVTEEELE